MSSFTSRGRWRAKPLLALIVTQLVLCPGPTVVSEEKQRVKEFNQPEKVFIAASGNSQEQAKQAIMIYLEEAMNDTEGDLLVEAKRDCSDPYTPNLLWGEIEYPPTSHTWWFRATWRITVKGGGYLFDKLSSRLSGGCPLN